MDQGCVPVITSTKGFACRECNVQVDDFVIVESANAVRGNWSISRIVNVYPRQDGKSGSGEYQRPLTKIVVIHRAEDYDSDED